MIEIGTSSSNIAKVLGLSVLAREISNVCSEEIYVYTHMPELLSGNPYVDRCINCADHDAAYRDIDIINDTTMHNNCNLCKSFGLDSVDIYPEIYLDTSDVVSRDLPDRYILTNTYVDGITDIRYPICSIDGVYIPGSIPVEWGSIGELCELVKNSMLVVCNDNYLQDISVALGSRCISLSTEYYYRTTYPRRHVVVIGEPSINIINSTISGNIVSGVHRC